MVSLQEQFDKRRAFYRAFADDQIVIPPEMSVTDAADRFVAGLLSIDELKPDARSRQRFEDEAARARGRAVVERARSSSQDPAYLRGRAITKRVMGRK